MRVLQIITALCIASNFSLYSMENEKYIGLKTYHPAYYAPQPKTFPSSSIYPYCAMFQLLKKKDPHNCAIVNAYILLNERPHESVEEQIKFYEQSIETIEKESNSTIDIFKKNKLAQQKQPLQMRLEQIKEASLSGKFQSQDIQQQLSTALCSMNAYNTWELNNLEIAINKANQFNTLNRNT